MPAKSKPTIRIEQLMTVKEVAECDRCSEKTVRRAISAGLLNAVRIGPGSRLLRVRPSDHAAYRHAQNT